MNITLWSVDSICVDADSGQVDATVTVVGGDDFYRMPETFVMRMPKTVALELFLKGLAEMAKQEEAVDICKEVQE